MSDSQAIRAALRDLLLLDSFDPDELTCLVTGRDGDRHVVFEYGRKGKRRAMWVVHVHMASHTVGIADRSHSMALEALRRWAEIISGPATRSGSAAVHILLDLRAIRRAVKILSSSHLPVPRDGHGSIREQVDRYDDALVDRYRA